MNRYLKDRAMRKDYRGDMRNPYGSRGGYVSSRHGRMRGRDRAMDYDYDYPEHDGRYDSRYDYGHESPRDYMGDQHYGERNRPMEYEMYGVGGMRPMYDYRGSRGRRMDYGYDYASEDMEKEWKEDLEEWCKKLKKHDRFNFSKEQILGQAKQMGVKFDDFSEDEFLTTYYMVMSDYPQVANEPHTYLAMAKDWLHDKDSELQGSDKLCAYYYEVIKAGKE
jgi:hypothetical protein